MKSVSTDFKTQARSDYKQVYATITDGTTTITQSDDIKSLKVVSNGGLCKTILKQADVRVWGNYAWLDKQINIKVGIDVNGTPEYIDYGDFLVTEVTQNEGSEERILKCFDLMYQSMVAYEPLDPSAYPITVLGLLQSICSTLGWTLATTTFTHSDLIIATELFSNQSLSYRDILEDIAEVSGTIMYFNSDNELVLRVVDTNTVQETLTFNDMLSLELGENWGELNSLALARDPQEDVIVQQDAESIELNGLWELRIVNNLILDSDRETYIADIFNTLNGIKYRAFESKTIGFGYFEVGDVIKVTDKANEEHTVLITDVDIDVSGAIKETIKGQKPDKSSTNYNTAGIIGKRITNTEIIVNKQEGEIALINEGLELRPEIPQQATAPESPEVNDMWLNTTDNVIYYHNGTEWIATALKLSDLGGYYTKGETDAQINLKTDTIRLSVEALETRVDSDEVVIGENSEDIQDIKSDVSSLELRADGIEAEVSSIGGSNLLKNSVGLKGSIEEWQVFDENGDLLDADNNGTVIQNSDVEENSESGSGIRIEQQYIVQTVPTIVGSPYMFYCRFKKQGNCNLSITGVGEMLSITAGDYVDETWAVYQYQFVANSSLTEIKISNTEEEVATYAILTDMVVKMGVVSGWVQAPNEVYGKNYKFDKDGFSVTSLTDEFKAVLDNVKLGIYDTAGGTDKIMALFSKDAGLITNLVAQDELTVQRYQNPSKSVRFIPTSTGCMIAVNN